MLTRGLIKARGDAMSLRTKLSVPSRPLMVAKDTIGTVYVYDQIGRGFFGEGGVTAKDLIEAIEQAKVSGAKRLDVRILSEGGDAFEGVGMFEALKRCGLPTTAYNDGLCASAATLVALGCDKVVAAPTSTWMAHRAFAMAGGTASDMRSMAKVLDKVDESIARIYATKSKKTQADCLLMMDAETWMTADECRAYGFADEVGRIDPETGELVEEPRVAAEAGAIVQAIARTQAIIATMEARERLADASARVNKTISGASPGSKKR